MSRRSHLYAATGSAAAAVLIGAAYVFGGRLRNFGGWAPFEAPEWFLGPIAGLGAVAALVYGVYSSRSAIPVRRLGHGIVWMMFWAICLAIPPAIGWGWFYAVTRSTVPAGGRVIFREFDIVQGDEVQDFTFRYETDLSLDEIEEFLHDRFERDGWQLKRTGYGVAGYGAEGMLGGTVRRGDGLRRYVAGKGGGEYWSIDVHDPGPLRRVHIHSGLEPALQERRQREQKALIQQLQQYNERLQRNQ